MPRHSYASRRAGRQMRRTTTRSGRASKQQQDSDPTPGSPPGAKVFGVLSILIFVVPAGLIALVLVLYACGP